MDAGVICDPDIYRSVKLLIDQYGPDAEHADTLLEPGKVVGATTWKTILRATGVLRRGRREGEPMRISTRPH